MLTRLLTRFHPSGLAPERDLAVIGDVHGCATLLQKALERTRGAQVVCVGDYIDRGPDSAAVLSILQRRPDIICLAGNHEDMLLGFIDDPERNGATWLRHGGLLTLESFGIDAATMPEGPDTVFDLRDALVAALGDAQIDWLRARPDHWVSGNVAVVHAGADPKLPIEQQDSRTLRWGHRGFQRTSRKDGMWVVHGHTVVPEAEVRGGRIAIDSGAYATGRLTIANITTGAVSFEVIGHD